LLQVFGLGVELHDSQIFFEDSVKDLHFCCVVKNFVTEVLLRGSTLGDDLLFDVMDFFRPFEHLLIAGLLLFLGLCDSFVHKLFALFVGLGRIVKIEHFEYVLVGSCKNLLIWPHF